MLSELETLRKSLQDKNKILKAQSFDNEKKGVVHIISVIFMITLLDEFLQSQRRRVKELEAVSLRLGIFIIL